MTVLDHYPPATLNLTVDRLPRWIKALGQAAAGTASANIFLVGDSTMAGYGATAGGGLDARAASYPARFAASLLGWGVPIVDDGFVSDQNIGAAGLIGPQYDPRLSYGAGWATSLNSAFCGGAIFNNSTANPLSFTPLAPFDSFDVYILAAPSSGTATVDIDGGTALDTLNFTQTAGIYKTSYTCTLGNHTVNFRRVSGIAYIFGVITYCAAAPGLRLFQLSHCGGSSSFFTAATYPIYNLPALTTLAAPALSILQIGLNDWLNGVSVTTYGSNMQTIISNALAVGDVLLVAPVASAVSAVSAAVQNAYINQLYILAVSNNIALVDFRQRWSGGYETLAPLGYYFDLNHPAGVGYSDIAGYLAKLLTLSAVTPASSVTPALVDRQTMLDAFIFG